MKTSDKFLLVALLAVSGCNSGSSGSSSSPVIESFPFSLPNGTSLALVSGSNVLDITVNGAGCSNTYPNKPCAIVTICEPGTANCVTVGDLLIDTGSYGLRVFKSALGSLNLPQITNASAVPVAECVTFGDGSSDWGPVARADLTIGNEPTITAPIQVIDSTYFSGHFTCGTPDTGPSVAGFNGILGIGLFAQDCGSTCVNTTNNGTYFACSGASCSGTKLSLANQVQNPVSAFPVDNNGVIFQLPNVAATGTSSVNGYLVFGVGTQSNNTPSGVSAYSADPSTGYFLTSFEGHTYRSFIDSGSNGLFFPNVISSSKMPLCSGGLAGWYCPPDQMILSATNSSYTGSPSGASMFQIVSMNDLMSTPNWVFPSAGGSSGTGGLGGLFDWGLPFYIGRNVYLGIEGKSSSLGSGTYWAY